jgi:hypothetical protein
MKSRALVRRLTRFLRCWFGFHGCGTSLLYKALRHQSGASGFATVRSVLMPVPEMWRSTYLSAVVAVSPCRSTWCRTGGSEDQTSKTPPTDRTCVQ